MRAEIITIGNELLIGQVVDSNAAFMAEKLHEAGIQLSRITTVSDTRKAIEDAVSESLQRSRLVLMTGGLGPTNDDVTKKVLAELFDTRLVTDEGVLIDLGKFLGSAGIPLNEQNRSQALVPEGCEVIRNTVGTAPILWFNRPGSVVVAMPGVPLEMKTALTGEVIPRIKARFSLPSLISRTIRVAGYAESMLAERLKEWEQSLPQGVSLAYLPAYAQIRLRLDAVGAPGEGVENILEAEIEGLKSVLGKAIFAFDDIEMQEAVGQMALQQGVTIATAESCTGGLVGHLLTSIAGSSGYFKGSVVAYDNGIKTGVLGVDADGLAQQGAVSAEVAEQMAQGVRRVMGADYGIATTGIAGPGGGTPDKPVGTIWIAASGPGGVHSKKFRFAGSRQQNIRISAQFALNMLRLRLLADRSADRE